MRDMEAIRRIETRSTPVEEQRMAGQVRNYRRRSAVVGMSIFGSD